MEKEYKQQQLDNSENKKSAGFGKYCNNNGYISLPLPTFQKRSNCLSNLGKEIRYLTHLVSIIIKNGIREVPT